MSRHDIRMYLEQKLPNGVYVYMGPPKHNTKIIFTDFYDTHKYYEFHLSLPATKDELLDQCDQEIAQFKTIWESPLRKALQEC